MNKSSAIIVPETRRDVAPPRNEQDAFLQAIVTAARDPDVDIEKMQRLMDMKDRQFKQQAESAFNSAMSDAQAEMGRVSADGVNPQTRSKYATYANLDREVRPIYAKHGFALSFDSGDAPLPDYVRVLCCVSHRGGHSRTYHADMPADGKGAKGGDVMTKTHAAGSAYSYGMRYLLKMIFNVAVGEDDDDGNSATNKPQTVPSPEGYARWKADMTAVADEGTTRLQDTWAKPESAKFRGYAALHDGNWWNGVKAKAAKASKASKSKVAT